MDRFAHAVRWLFDSEQGAIDRLIPRWLFLRALGGIYFSAFFSLVFQICGLIGPQGILPGGEYLQAVARTLGQPRPVVRAHGALELKRSASIDRALLGRYARIAAADSKCSAARN